MAQLKDTTINGNLKVNGIIDGTIPSVTLPVGTIIEVSANSVEEAKTAVQKLDGTWTVIE